MGGGKKKGEREDKMLGGSVRHYIKKGNKDTFKAAKVPR
jgi:hypothetical protein